VVDEYPEERIEGAVKAYYGARAERAVLSVFAADRAAYWLPCCTEDECCRECLITG
jgi:hypothetical protein